MQKNRSPWLHQLDHERAIARLTTDIETDVAVIGAGIAGVATAFFILKYTDKRVAVLERYRLAHGATGHNAGQVVGHFERGFANLVGEFGIELAGDGQRAVEGAWELLDEMYTDAGLDIPFSRFQGHTGLISYEQVLLRIENNRLRKEAGLDTEEILVADDAPFLANIGAELAEFYRVVPRQEILDLLETKFSEFVGVLNYQKGCVNSALFCQEVINFLLARYPDRFALYEHTPVHKVILHANDALIDAESNTVTAKRVVLCTNGFESLHILNETGLDIDARYHHLVSGKVGYMSGYLEKMNKTPIAMSYFIDPNPSPETSYFYITRRPYEYEKGVQHNLISVGGPDADLEEAVQYSLEDDYPDEMVQKIDDFLHTVYDIDPNRKIEYVFTWHGLMGYTKNRVRMAGEEPQNRVLLYNLGCNGIGILPSVYGGRKIARHIAGEQVPKSIFDIPTH